MKAWTRFSASDTGYNSCMILPGSENTQVLSNRAKMVRCLILLAVMGQFSFFSCHLHEYHLIKEEKTWDEAQNYCRDKYTDLATVCDVTDTRRLGDLVTTPAWIGLHSILGKDNRKWHWSLTEMPGVEPDDIRSYFGDGEPNPLGNIENCVEITGNKLNDIQCSKTHEFICFDEREEPSERLQVINLKIKWTQAQKYCREHHTDLLSGLDQLQEFKMQSIENKYMWIGLFRDTWSWSNGSKSSFRNWGQGLFKDGHDKKECATVLNSLGEWGSDDCNEKKPFFCYDDSAADMSSGELSPHNSPQPNDQEDKVVLVTQELTWEEALNYCREHHRDLVSITNPQQQKWVQARAKSALSNYVWLGLPNTCTMGLVCYENWKTPDDGKDLCGNAVAMEKNGEHKIISLCVKGPISMPF
ncbi:C-type mannose receptor 2-like [Notolabrus celidotus]|uniref:C-type mannose receptor 2-like n=1 Tax=Notolabrus celidotus TaxID=1203425 RepID=UPI00148F4F5E|nr:C-type mannose receptor 2-like [Notolabrus celidotus]